MLIRINANLNKFNQKSLAYLDKCGIYANSSFSFIVSIHRAFLFYFGVSVKLIRCVSIYGGFKSLRFVLQKQRFSTTYEVFKPLRRKNTNVGLSTLYLFSYYRTIGVSTLLLLQEV